MAKDNSVIIVPKLSSTSVVPKQTVTKNKTVNFEKIKEIANSISYSVGVKSILTKNISSEWDEQIGVSYYLLKDSNKFYLIITQFSNNEIVGRGNFGGAVIDSTIIKEPLKVLTTDSYEQLNNRWTPINYRSNVAIESYLSDKDFDSRDRFFSRKIREPITTQQQIYNDFFDELETINYKKDNFVEDFLNSFNALRETNILETHSKIIEISKSIPQTITVSSTNTGNLYYLAPFSEKLLYKTDDFLPPLTNAQNNAANSSLISTGVGTEVGVFYADNIFMPYYLICNTVDGDMFAVTYYNEKFIDLVNDFLQFYNPLFTVEETKDTLNNRIETISKGLTDDLTIRSNLTDNVYTLSTYSNVSGYIVDGKNVSYYISVLKTNGTYDIVSVDSELFSQIANDFLNAYVVGVRSIETNRTFTF